MFSGVEMRMSVESLAAEIFCLPFRAKPHFVAHSSRLQSPFTINKAWCHGLHCTLTSCKQLTFM